jgi:glycine hydroxymethyltransferase
MTEQRNKESHRLFKELMDKEERQSYGMLHMTANENRLSRFAQRALSTSLSYRYHLGTPGDYNFDPIVQKPNLIFRGMPNLYRLESLAHEVLNDKLGGTVTDTRILSGLHAIICSVTSLTRPGDTVLSLCPDGGGHFATANLVNSTGRKSVLVDYDREKLTISLPHLEKLRKAHDIKALILDDSAPLYPMPIREIRDIMGDDVIIVYDASHTLGLIMGGHFLHPIQDGCDVIQGNTHKTFPGPQKGLLHFADGGLAAQAMDVIGSTLVSSQHTHHSLALYITILEMEIHAEHYAAATIANAKALSKALNRNGFHLLTNGESYTETHQVLFTVPQHLAAFDACKKLFNCGISMNAKNVYNRDVIRIGVQELTRLGMKAGEMEMIAGIIKSILLESELRNSAAKVQELRSAFQDVHYSFDQEMIFI